MLFLNRRYLNVLPPSNLKKLRSGFWEMQREGYIPSQFKMRNSYILNWERYRPLNDLGLMLVFYSLCISLSRRVDSVHWISFRRLAYSVTTSYSPSETNSYNKPCSNIRLPCPSTVPSSSRRSYNLFRWVRPRHSPRRPSGRWNRRLRISRFRRNQRNLDINHQCQWNGR